jgi:protein-L-isoaspartate(D-aspartate) O-methyltransferase
MDLVDSLIAEGWLKTSEIIRAFKAIKRVDFLPDDIKDLAELNEALPIDYGQTISQPLTVAFMMELLQPQPGDKILDIGSGSGYTTALLAAVVSQKSKVKSQNYNPKFKSDDGKVIGIETISGLVEFGRENVAKYNFIEKGIVQIVCDDGAKGCEPEAPYDRILVSASTQKDIPKAWKEQLKPGGRLVCPINNSIWLIIKKGENDFEQIEYPGFVFVPLV